ncbi:MAG: NAD(P)/FAD-dependent oxidoreductase [Lachnospiraceae bacterium]|nr:NAD(P)/FAD-dependent oxidoreductase [Lachnospiraceae bacterium]
MTDVIIIGAGITGSCIARELSRQKRKILVLEKASDVCEGTSKANSGIIHGGYDAKPGTLKARLNVMGSMMMEDLSRELDFPYIRNGSLVLAPEGSDMGRLDELLERGIKNGVKGLRIVDREELKYLEPNVNDRIEAALYVPSGAIADPFLMTVAMAENAAVNGVDFSFGEEVIDIERTDSGYRVITTDSVYESGYVINAAGVYADKIHGMVSKDPMEIVPVRGQYCLFDNELSGLVKHTLFKLPTEKGKGILVTPTAHGNIMAGPTAETLEDKEAVNTTAEGIATVLKEGALSVKELPERKVITSFSGLRAHEVSGDFIIREASDARGFIDVAGIESPGLSAAPAIAEYVSDILNKLEPSEYRTDHISKREGIPVMSKASYEERQRLIKEDPLFGNVICRCEFVTEGEIVRAINRPLGATTLDGVKRRVRAGMGRCQGGFCSPRVVEILARELSKDPGEIRKNDPGSELLAGYNKKI